MKSSAYPGNGRGRARDDGGAAEPAAAGTIPCGARRSPLSVALTLALSLTAGPAAAAGLGRIELASGLNERLDARIPLYNASDYPPGSIEVGLASPERFRAADMERPHALTGLRFELEPAPSGSGHVIRVRSPDAIVEPFLRFLVAVDLPDGRLVRAYTVLLDPPSFAPETAPVVQSTPTTADVNGSRGEAATAAAESTTTAPTAGADRFGPVARGSSAWRVAEQVQPPGVSIYQTMVALRRANPGAFRDGDLGQLREGVWLDVPAAAEIAAIPQARAVGIYRQYLADNGESATGAETSANSATAAAGDAAGGSAPPVATVTPDATTRDVAVTEGAATASTGVVSAGAEGARRVPAPGPRLEQVRTDIAGLETTIAGLRERVDGGLTDQAQGIAQLRAALANVRGELATLRESRAEPAAAGGTPLWATGLIALLAAGVGAFFGFTRGRRVAAPDGVAMAAAAGSAASGPAGEAPGRTPAPLAGTAEEAPAEASAAPTAQEPVAGESAAAGPEGDVDTDRDDAMVSVESGEVVPEFVPGPDPGRAPEPAPGTRADVADWIDPEGVTAAEPDSYQSLADLCLEAGWARDAEGVLRDAIDQRGDDTGYRAGILAALHHEGVADEFRREFERYRAIAADDDPNWPAVLSMGRELCPGDPAFAAAAPADPTPAAAEPGDAPLELDDFDPGELDDLEALEALDPADGIAGDAPADAPELPDGDEPGPDVDPVVDEGPAAGPADPEGTGEPGFELSLDTAEPAAPDADAEDPAGRDADWPELDLDDVVPAGESADTGATAEPDPDATPATGAGTPDDPSSAGDATVGAAAADDDDPAAPLPTLDTDADGDHEERAAAAGPREATVVPVEGDDDGDFNLSLARVYLKAGWARDAEAVLREAIAQHGEEPAYRARLLEALYQAEARNEFLQAFDEYRAMAPDDDPDWVEVRRMGRSLWPTHEAFAEPGPAGERPASDAADEASEEAAEPPRRRRRA